MTKASKPSKTRDNVVSVRLDDASIQAIDLLVQSGLAQSRSDGAAQLIALGIQAADDLLLRARELRDKVHQIRQDMVEAVKGRNVDRVKALLAEDETLANATNEQGETAVLMAAYYHAHEIRDLLITKRPTLNFYEACSVGDTTRALQLLDENPTLLNQHNADGYTPLGLASFFGHPETVNCLLHEGADVNQLSRDGQMNNTALHAAIAGDYKEIAQSLIQLGADVNARAHGKLRAGFTPLHVAVRRNNQSICAMLLYHGADIHARNDAGQTPLDYALEQTHTELANWFRSQAEIK